MRRAPGRVNVLLVVHKVDKRGAMEVHVDQLASKVAEARKDLACAAAHAQLFDFVLSRTVAAPAFRDRPAAS